jgi:hypothetical protein
MPLNAARVFPVREVPPTLRLTKPFPTVLMIQRSASTTRRDLLRSSVIRIAVGFLPTPAAANRASKVGSSPFRFAALLRSGGGLLLQVADLMVAAELRQRPLVELK